MNELREKSEQVWGAIVGKIQDAMQPDEVLDKVKYFQPLRRGRVTQVPSPLLTVLSRTVHVQEYGANRGIAHQSILFGVTGTSYEPQQVSDVITEVVWDIADMFLLDPTLDGLVFDTKLERLSPDDMPPAQEESTQSWATVELTWEYEFLRN